MVIAGVWVQVLCTRRAFTGKHPYSFFGAQQLFYIEVDEYTNPLRDCV